MNAVGSTSCIEHLVVSGNLKGITFIKLCSGVIGSFFKSLNDNMR